MLRWGGESFSWLCVVWLCGREASPEDDEEESDEADGEQKPGLFALGEVGLGCVLGGGLRKVRVCRALRGGCRMRGLRRMRGGEVLGWAGKWSGADLGDGLA